MFFIEIILVFVWLQPSGQATARTRQLPDESHILSLAAKDLVQILGLKVA